MILKIISNGKNCMKYFRNSATYLVLIYVTVLGLAALLSAWYPSQIASFVHFFLPIDIDLTTQSVSHSFIRYRMFLWLIATMVFLVLVPLVGYFGIPETNFEKFQRIHWMHFVVAILMLPIGWIFYPIVALCITCWTSNDAFYFALTVSFFGGLQMLAHAIILKTKLIFRKK